jgi:hypothetical protein
LIGSAGQGAAFQSSFGAATASFKSAVALVIEAVGTIFQPSIVAAVDAIIAPVATIVATINSIVPSIVAGVESCVRVDIRSIAGPGIELRAITRLNVGLGGAGPSGRAGTHILRGCPGVCAEPQIATRSCGVTAGLTAGARATGLSVDPTRRGKYQSPCHK